MSSLHTGHEAIKKPKWFQRRDGGSAVNQFSAQNCDPMRKDLSETAYDALRIYAQALEIVTEAAIRKAFERPPTMPNDASPVKA